MGIPKKSTTVNDLSNIGSLFANVPLAKVQKHENRTGAEGGGKIKGTSKLSAAVNEVKKGRVHYMHKTEESTKNVLEGNEFVAEWAKGVQLARVVSSSGTKCMVTDGHNTFPVLTEKNAPLSEAMQKFIDQIKPDRYIPLRFGMSHAGNKKATRDDAFCQRINHYYTKTLSQTFEGKEYYQGITVGYDSQMNPLVYSSHDKTIYVVDDTVLGANLFGDDVLLDYHAGKMIPVYKPIREKEEKGEETAEVEEAEEMVEVDEEVDEQLTERVAEEVAEKIVQESAEEVAETPVTEKGEVVETPVTTESTEEMFKKAIEGLGEAPGAGFISQETALDIIAPVGVDINHTLVRELNNGEKSRPHNSNSGTQEDDHQNKHGQYSSNTTEKMFNDHFPNKAKIAQLNAQSQQIADVLLRNHPKVNSSSQQYRLDSLTQSFLHEKQPLQKNQTVRGTKVRSKNGVAGVIVPNINPETNKPFNKSTPGMVKVQYFRKDPSSGKERSVSCMTKIENLYAVPKRAVPPTNRTDKKGC